MCTSTAQPIAISCNVFRWTTSMNVGQGHSRLEFHREREHFVEICEEIYFTWRLFVYFFYFYFLISSEPLTANSHYLISLTFLSGIFILSLLFFFSLFFIFSSFSSSSFFLFFFFSFLDSTSDKECFYYFGNGNRKWEKQKCNATFNQGVLMPEISRSHGEFRDLSIADKTHLFYTLLLSSGILI